MLYDATINVIYSFISPFQCSLLYTEKQLIFVLDLNLTISPNSLINSAHLSVEASGCAACMIVIC